VPYCKPCARANPSDWFFPPAQAPKFKDHCVAQWQGHSSNFDPYSGSLCSLPCARLPQFLPSLSLQLSSSVRTPERFLLLLETDLHRKSDFPFSTVRGNRTTLSSKCFSPILVCQAVVFGIGFRCRAVWMLHSKGGGPTQAELGGPPFPLGCCLHSLFLSPTTPLLLQTYMGQSLIRSVPNSAPPN